MFACQCLILFIVIAVSLYNLSITTPEEYSKEALWALLISGCLGICCPGPVIKWSKKEKKKVDDCDVNGQFQEDGDCRDDSSQQREYELVSVEQGLGLQGSTSCSVEAWGRMGGRTDGI